MTIVILSISSDIGIELAKSYLTEGHRVIGTYRKYGRLTEIESYPNCILIRCDISQKKDIRKLLVKLKSRQVIWDTFISCAGDLRPVGGFFKNDFDEWEKSVVINSIAQLRVLHSVYPLRNTKKESNAVFFAGGGVNNPVVNLSAYTISKIVLIKMCEYLDAENRDMNIFIIGPGWTRTKIHQAVLNSKIKGKNYTDTVEFLKSKKGTKFDEIYDCIEWLVKQGKVVAGGRNFSVAYDQWRGEKGSKLAKVLKADINMYKLRRNKNFQQI